MQGRESLKSKAEKIAWKDDSAETLRFEPIKFLGGSLGEDSDSAKYFTAASPHSVQYSGGNICENDQHQLSKGLCIQHTKKLKSAKKVSRIARPRSVNTLVTVINVEQEVIDWG